MKPDAEDRLIAQALREAGRPAWLNRMMGLRLSAVAVLVVLLLAAAGWFFRWEAVRGDRGMVYMVNRWTGEVRLLLATEWHPVTQARP